MNPFFILLPAALMAAAVAYGIFRAVSRVWLEHRVKIALLERLEKHPEMTPSPRELEELLRSATHLTHRRQDFTLTGTLVAVLGLMCVGAGRFVLTGRLAVGMYFGGLICVCLGFLVALIGLFVRNMGGQEPPRS